MNLGKGCPTKEDWEKLIQNPKIIGDSNKGVIVEHEVELKETTTKALLP
ncbi:MAG: hypothetical protein ACLU93_03095 [Streptococcus sp.]